MIPVDREPGPWSKYIERELTKVEGGYPCEKCGGVFHVVSQLISHRCPVELQEKIDNVRSRLGEADLHLPPGVDCIDSGLCVGSLEAINVLRKKNSPKVEILDVRSYFDPVTWNPYDSIYRLVDILIMNTWVGKISVIHCFAGIDRSPFAACLYLGKRYNIPFAEAYKLVKERRPQTTIHTDWLTLMGLDKV